MASTTHYVDTTLGTDDGDHGLSSGSGAFATLAYAENFIDGTLYDATETATINCSGTTADTTAVTFAGWDADVSIIVNGNYAATSGVHWSTSYYRLEPATATAIINAADLGNAVTFNKIQILTHAQGINWTQGSSNLTVDRCIIHGVSTVDFSNGIQFDCTSKTCVIKNCVIYGFTQVDDDNCGISSSNNEASSTVTISNCTIYDNDTGIKRLAHTVTAKNCAVFNNDDDYNGTMTVTYSASDDTQAGTGNVDWASGATDWAANFVDYANFDFHLKSTAPLINAGTDLFGSGVTTDIDGDTLSVRNDIGADEYVVPGDYYIYLFKDYNGAPAGGTVTWIGQSSADCSASTAYLQIYNETTDTWITIDFDNTTAKHTDFTLTGTFPTSGYTADDFFTSGNHVNCRVYQLL